MKKGLVLLFVLVVSVLLVQTPSQAQTKFGFKVTGGLAYVGGGDANAGLTGWSDVWKALWGFSSSTAGYSPFHLGMDFGGEFIIDFGPSFGLGLGAGYIQSSKSSQLATTSGNYTWNPKLSAVPVTLTFYYHLPASGSLKVNLFAGAGYYIAKYTDAQHIIFLGAFDRNIDTSANGLGFHGGIGLEFALSPMISFVAEARGRFAPISGFSGSTTFPSGGTPLNGKMYYMEGTFLGISANLLEMSTSAPTGFTLQREAKIDLSGFSAVVGFLFHF